MKNIPYEANRSLAVLRKMFSLALGDFELLKGVNPASGIALFPETRRTRYYPDDEMAVIGATLLQAETAGTEQPSVIAAIRLLAMTGCRVSEVIGLKWKRVNLRRGTSSWSTKTPRRGFARCR